METLVANPIIAEYDQWVVKMLEGTPEKLQQVWSEISSHRSLFSDTTEGDVENFKALMFSPDVFWMEVLDRQGNLVGVMYLTDTQLLIDASVHLVFFDRKLSEKAGLCREVLRWLFHHFAYRRLTAYIPSIYYATVRLAKKIGFKDEGLRRDAYLIGNKWVDEVILGILRSEVI